MAVCDDINALMDRLREVGYESAGGKKVIAAAPTQWNDWLLPPEYLDVLDAAGAFRLADRSFQLFGVSPLNGPARDALAWNRAVWREGYGFLTANLFFFGCDAFGNQFAYDFGSPAPYPEIVFFDCESGESDPIGPSIVQFLLDNVLRWNESFDPMDRALLGEASDRGLIPGWDEDLAFRVPVSSGGAINVENLEILKSDDHLKSFGPVALRVHAENEQRTP